jgi:hypothetical protein
VDPPGVDDTIARLDRRSSSWALATLQELSRDLDRFFARRELSHIGEALDLPQHHQAASRAAS